MKVFDYKPKAEGWSGSIKLKIPNFKERLAVMKELGLQDVASKDQLELAGKIIDKVAEHVESVDLAFGDEVFKSLEDLEYSKQGSDLINEIGAVLMQGIGLGKS